MIGIVKLEVVIATAAAAEWSDNMKPKLLISTIKISQPAQRALKGAGIETLDQLTQYKEEELLALHGFGNKGLEILKTTLAEYGLSFKPL